MGGDPGVLCPLWGVGGGAGPRAQRSRQQPTPTGLLAPRMRDVAQLSRWVASSPQRSGHSRCRQPAAFAGSFRGGSAQEGSMRPVAPGPALTVARDAAGDGTPARLRRLAGGGGRGRGGPGLAALLGCGRVAPGWASRLHWWVNPASLYPHGMHGNRLRCPEAPPAPRVASLRSWYLGPLPRRPRPPPESPSSDRVTLKPGGVPSDQEEGEGSV